jgi:PAS domain-containing protein
MYGEISKIISIAHDITEQKEMELLTKKQNELLKKQEEELKAHELELQRKLDEARKEVKAQFQEIEKVKVRNEKTLEGAHDAIFTINQNGVVEFFNRSAESLWGYSRKEVIGNSVKSLLKNIPEEDELMFNFCTLKSESLGTRKEVQIYRR